MFFKDFIDFDVGMAGSGVLARMQTIGPAVKRTRNGAVFGVDFAFVKVRRVIMRADIGDGVQTVAHAKNSDLQFFVKFHAHALAPQNVRRTAYLHKRSTVAFGCREIVVGVNIHKITVFTARKEARGKKWKRRENSGARGFCGTFPYFAPCPETLPSLAKPCFSALNLVQQRLGGSAPKIERILLFPNDKDARDKIFYKLCYYVCFSNAFIKIGTTKFHKKHIALHNNKIFYMIDFTPFFISFRLAFATVAVLLVFGVPLAFALAFSRSRYLGALDALVSLPLALPPTVLGFYLLYFLGGASPVGAFFREVFGVELVFSFTGLVVGSSLYCLPFMTQTVKTGLEALPKELIESARLDGAGRWRIAFQVALPLAAPSVFTGSALVFVHALGEFGVVMMLGGNIAGETRTASVALYDATQAFDDEAAQFFALGLLAVAFALSACIRYASRAWSQEQGIGLQGENTAAPR